MADFAPVPFDGGPTSAPSDPGSSPSVMDGAENVPQEVPAGAPPETEEIGLSFGEDAIADDGSSAGTLEEAAAFFAKQGIEAAPPEPLEAASPPAAAPGEDEDFFAVMGEDPDIGSEYAASLREKYGGNISAAIRGLVSGNRRLSQRDEEAAAWKSFQQNPEAYLQQMGVAPPEPKPEDTQEKVKAEYDKYLAQVWGAPDHEEIWETQVDVVSDAEGNPVGFRAKPGIDPSIPQKLQAWYEFKRKKSDEFLRDPTTIWNALAPGVQSLVRQEVMASRNQDQARVGQQAAASAFVENNSYWLYNTVDGPGGQKLLGPRTDENLTPAGKVFAEGMAEANKLGISSVEGRIQYAGRMLQHAYATRQQQQPQPPPAAPPSAAAGVNQTVAAGLDNGNFYDPAEGLSLEEKIRRNLAAAGISA